MTPESIVAFASLFFLLALAPGAGLAMILSRTLGSGIRAGLAVTSGLVLGDFVFLGLAATGLSAMATAMGPLFQVIKWVGAAYLVWLGIQAFRSAAKPLTIEAQATRGFWRELGTGLLVTMGNPKPLLFYGAVLPSFLDLHAIGIQDYVVLGGIVVGISYVVYGGYMLVVERARRLLVSTRALKRLNQATGTMFIGSGVLVATR